MDLDDTVASSDRGCAPSWLTSVSARFIAVGRVVPLNALEALGAVEPSHVVATHVAHRVLRRVSRLAPREDARREVAVLVCVPDLVAQRSGVRAREEAVDDDDVLGL